MARRIEGLATLLTGDEGHGGACPGRLGHPFVLYQRSMLRVDSRGVNRRG
jgi:hypothetical protein